VQAQQVTVPAGTLSLSGQVTCVVGTRSASHYRKAVARARCNAGRPPAVCRAGLTNVRHSVWLLLPFARMQVQVEYDAQLDIVHEITAHVFSVAALVIRYSAC
jgi:hypothetical protein